LLGVISTLARGSYRSGAIRLAGRPSAPTSTAATSTSSASTVGPATGPSPAGGGTLPPRAVRLGASAQLPRNQGALYADPTDGQPDIIIRHSDGSLNAFSAVCTHQGCEVGYQGGGQIQCPCHGGLYNARTGAVEGGPPPAPLPPRRVLERGGTIYAIPS